MDQKSKEKQRLRKRGDWNTCPSEVATTGYLKKSSARKADKLEKPTLGVLR